MSNQEKLKTLLALPKTKKYAFRFLAVVLIFGLLGVFALPPLLKSLLVDNLEKTLHRKVTIDKVLFNPYTLTLSVKGVNIEDSDGAASFARFDTLRLNLSANSLLRRGLVLKEVFLENPQLNLRRFEDKRYNFSDLVDEFNAKPASDSPMMAFSLNNIQLVGGQINFADQASKDKPAYLVSDIQLRLPFLSNMAYAAESFVEPAFSAKIDGAPIQMNGLSSQPFGEGLETTLTFDIAALALEKYVDYLPQPLPVALKSGSLETKLALHYQQDKDKNKLPSLTLSGLLAVNDLVINEVAGRALLSLKRLELELGSFDLFTLALRVDRLALESPKVTVSANKRGVINWLSVFSGSKAKKPSKTAPASKPFLWEISEGTISDGSVFWQDDSRKKPLKASLDGLTLALKNLGSTSKTADFDLSWRVKAQDWLTIEQFKMTGGKFNLAKQEVSIGKVFARGVNGLIRRTKNGEIEWLEPPALRALEASQKNSSKPWKVSIADYVGEAMNWRFYDKFVSPEAFHSLENISVNAKNLSTDAGQVGQIKANAAVNKNGTLALEGSLRLNPLDLSFSTEFKKLDLVPFQAYLADKMAITLKRGVVNGQGKFDVKDAGKLSGGLSGGFSGELTLGDFQMADNTTATDFLRWKSLYFGNLAMRFGPESLSVGEVSLSDFFARLNVNPQGKLNLREIFANPPKKSAAAAPLANVTDTSAAENTAASDLSAKEMPLKIGKLTLQGGLIRFSDNFIKPNYSATLRNIGGQVTGLSSEAGSRATMELRGNYDSVAKLLIAGKINPFSAKPYLDVKADINGIELRSLSSYAARYAGYAIEKGKLSLALNYKLENDQLEAQNRIFLDQLTFGEAVDSPEAIQLPITLAVSLLKNRNGEIDINLPISGSLNDPEFSVGGIIGELIFSMLGKALTSPFSLIGSMFGGSEELSTLDFEPGSWTISPDMEKRLDTIRTALLDRPSLKLEIEGVAGGKNDPEGFKKTKMERKVRALKRRDLRDSDSAVMPSRQAGQPLIVSAEEYPALLERVYKEEKFPKPRNLVGLVKSLPVEEMEKLILANSTIEEEDLNELGDRRAKAVRDWFLAHEVAAERLFLVPSQIIPAGENRSSEAKVHESRVNFTLK